MQNFDYFSPPNRRRRWQSYRPHFPIDYDVCVSTRPCSAEHTKHFHSKVRRKVHVPKRETNFVCWWRGCCLLEKEIYIWVDFIGIDDGTWTCMKLNSSENSKKCCCQITKMELVERTEAWVGPISTKKEEKTLSTGDHKAKIRAVVECVESLWASCL